MTDKEFSRDREIAVVLERIHSQFKLFAESQDITNKKLDDTINIVGRNAEGITMLRAQVSGIKEELTEIKSRLTVVENRLTRVEDRLTCVEDRLTCVEDEVKEIKVSFGRRLTRLEKICE